MIRCDVAGRAPKIDLAARSADERCDVEVDKKEEGFFFSFVFVSVALTAYVSLGHDTRCPPSPSFYRRLTPHCRSRVRSVSPTSDLAVTL